MQRRVLCAIGIERKCVEMDVVEDVFDTKSTEELNDGNSDSDQSEDDGTKEDIPSSPTSPNQRPFSRRLSMRIPMSTILADHTPTETFDESLMNEINSLIASFPSPPITSSSQSQMTDSLSSSSKSAMRAVASGFDVVKSFWGKKKT